jgi:hypothetical protein
MRRYFLGLVSFAFVAVWAAAGMLPAALSLLACVLTVSAPRLLGRRTAIRSHRSVHERRQRHPVRTRPLRNEVAPTLPMVPDEPSLIVELG